ncbi:peptide ABC transporter [Brevundimonas sp. Leaf363]|uniref:peptide MFS transporter n=1 Tax=Brevundimonas sp. Leaf363 TaxID=1736353 RepID=UPI0006FCD968|nr:oligopeptide:H+ symporter [Brevundimonas sp. Leaf363]KQS53707.1 peptide ABC transporter [Brevundimonas sp. Leaf363]
MNLVILLGVVITLATGLPVLLQILKNHPRGLIICFFAEMWERFSFYGMRGLLIFYLTQHFLFDDGFATGQYGTYGSLVYLLPLIGGIVADRYIGTRKAIMFGAVLLVLGHGLMGFEGRPATQTLQYGGQSYAIQMEGRADGRESRVLIDGQPYAYASSETGLAIEGLPATASVPAVLPTGQYELSAQRDPMGVNVFYLALSLIIMGVGFLKPNISTLVGQLYPQGDPRRDSGFTLYYYGINLGAFWAAVLCGYLGQNFGWGWGFGLAGIGMALGLVVFWLGKPLLQGKGESPYPELIKKPLVGPINREWLIYILGFVGVGALFFVVPNHELVGIGLLLSTIAAIGFIAWFIIFKLRGDKVARERMMLASVLIFGSAVFFTLFEQAGSSLNLFADRNVDLSITATAGTLFGIPYGTPAQMAAAGLSTTGFWIDTTITAAQTQSFNAAYILIFAPVFAALWAFLGARKIDPNPVVKFGLGIIQVGLGFLVVVWGANSGMVDDAFRTPVVLLALLYLLHTTGELFLSPVGLSEITKLSVASIVSFMMAVWFMSSSIAHFIGGIIAGMAGTETVGGQVTNPQAALNASLESFNAIGWVGVGIGVFFLVISLFIAKWSNGANDAGNHPGPVITDGGKEDGNIAKPGDSTVGA